jgi:hypothetical protein
MVAANNGATARQVSAVGRQEGGVECKERKHRKAVLARMAIGVENVRLCIQVEGKETRAGHKNHMYKCMHHARTHLRV